MKFATPETIKQPTGGLVLEKKQNQDCILGGTKTLDWEVLVSKGHWSEYAPPAELQKNSRGDVYGCVSFSYNNAHEFIYKKRYNEDLNKSDRFIVVGSGTVPYQGNSKRTVAEWGRKNFWVNEEQWPYTPTMTVDEYYNDRKVPSELLKEGQKLSPLYSIEYQWLVGNGTGHILTGLEFSPVQVDVENYVFNQKGYIKNSNTGYVHEVIIFDYEEGECWWVFDSESLQFIKFDWNYNFGSPMIHSLKKKFMPKLYKKNGESAIYFLNPEDGLLVPFSDGVIEGGSLFKIFFGDYKNVVINKVDVLPAHIATYSIKTI